MRNVGFCKELNVSLNSLYNVVAIRISSSFPTAKTSALQVNAMAGGGGGDGGEKRKPAGSP